MEDSPRTDEPQSAHASAEAAQQVQLGAAPEPAEAAAAAAAVAADATALHEPCLAPQLQPGAAAAKEAVATAAAATAAPAAPTAATAGGSVRAAAARLRAAVAPPPRDAYLRHLATLAPQSPLTLGDAGRRLPANARPSLLQVRGARQPLVLCTTLPHLQTSASVDASL